MSNEKLIAKLRGLAERQGEDYIWHPFKEAAEALEAAERQVLYHKTGNKLATANWRHASKRAEAAEARERDLKKLIRECMPALEKMESELLVGDEGCIFSVEMLRDAVEPASKGAGTGEDIGNHLRKEFLTDCEKCGVTRFEDWPFCGRADCPFREDADTNLSEIPNSSKPPEPSGERFHADGDAVYHAIGEMTGRIAGCVNEKYARRIATALGEVERLKAALEPFARAVGPALKDDKPSVMLADLLQAKAALEGENEC